MKNKNVNPLISILCITYNHEKYIAQALDSFLAQETNFPIEVIVHDDASTDKTTSILRQYAQAHPDVIKPIYEKENQYSKSKGNVPFINEMYKQAKGTYIADCEGDDYWTDPQKLQLQVDFLESNPSYALVFHPTKVFFENGEEPESIYPAETDPALFTVKELLKRNYIHGNAVMYRKQSYDELAVGVMPFDWYTHLYHAQFGKIGFINRTMSAYRRHAGGIWWDAYDNLDKIWVKHGIAHLSLYMEILKMYGKKTEYRLIIQQSIASLLDSFINVDTKQNLNLLEQALGKSPEYTSEIAALESLRAHDLQVEVTNLTQATVHLEKALKDELELSERTVKALRDIQASRIWKLRDKLRGHR